MSVSPDVQALVTLENGRLTVHASNRDQLVIHGLLSQAAVSVAMTRVDGHLPYTAVPALDSPQGAATDDRDRKNTDPAY